MKEIQQIKMRKDIQILKNRIQDIFKKPYKNI